MLLTSLLSIVACAASATALLDGFDISNYQAGVDVKAQAAKGAKFVYIKATEGVSYKSPSFSAQYNGATSAGLIRGGYHFAQIQSSSGAQQAKYFAANGGGWSNDGRTLPGMLDLEEGNGGQCHGVSPTAYVSWVKDFSNTYHSLTGRYPVIYTRAALWNTCTNSNTGFAATNPLFIARYASAVGSLPAGWSYWTFWQYSDAGKFAGDSDYFNGDASRLKALAQG